MPPHPTAETLHVLLLTAPAPKIPDGDFGSHKQTGESTAVFQDFCMYSQQPFEMIKWPSLRRYYFSVKTFFPSSSC